VPTFEKLPRFQKDWKTLEHDLQVRFRDKVKKEFVPAINEGFPYPGGLRMKGIQGATGIWEMTWAPNGRATWQFGEEITKGDPHVIWRRIGNHEIFNLP